MSQTTAKKGLVTYLTNRPTLWFSLSVELMGDLLLLWLHIAWIKSLFVFSYNHTDYVNKWKCKHDCLLATRLNGWAESEESAQMCCGKAFAAVTLICKQYLPENLKCLKNNLVKVTFAKQLTFDVLNEDSVVNYNVVNCGFKEANLSDFETNHRMWLKVVRIASKPGHFLYTRDIAILVGRVLDSYLLRRDNLVGVIKGRLRKQIR